MFLFQDNQTSCTLYFTIHQKMSIIGAKIVNLPQYGTKKQKFILFLSTFHQKELKTYVTSSNQSGITYTPSKLHGVTLTYRLQVDRTSTREVNRAST